MKNLRAPSFLIAPLLGVFLLVATAAADEVVLWSGERLTGRIVDKSTDELVLETAAADVVRIKWDEIFALRTDAPMDQMLTRSDDFRIPMASLGADCTSDQASSGAAFL